MKSDDFSSFPPYKKARVADLIPYARNARTHSDAQVAQIAASIREFGFTNPVLVDGERGIIAGHGRVMAARKLGMTEVPTIELGHLTDAQRKAYILADNKLALNAGWDDEMLRLELGELKIEGFDLDLTGFGEHEIKNLIDSDESIDDKLPPDEFGSYGDDIETEHECPKCGYRFSGGKKNKAGDEGE